MITGKEDLLQALIEAFLMEKGTKLFYADAAEKAINPDVIKTFQELADWEEKHMEFILYLYRSINGDQELKSFEEFKKGAKAPVTEGGIPIKELQEKMENYTYSDEMGALTLALEIEGKAYRLYHNLSKSAADTNAQVVFREMVDQEIKHIEYLKSLRVKLADVYK